MRIRPFLLVGTHLAAGVLGAMLAWWVMDALRQANAMVSDMALISYYTARVELQRDEGGPDAYRDALVAFLAALDELHLKSEGGFSPASIVWTDRMLVRVQLARLEEQVGNLSMAADHMSEARAACEKIPWDNCEPDHLVGVVQRMERNSLLRSGGSTS